MYMLHRAFHQALRCYAVIFFHQFLFQRAAVYTDANGNLFFLRHIYYLLDACFVPDIPRIDAYLINAQLHYAQRQSVVKMNVRNKGDMNPFFDFADCVCCRHIRNCYAHQFAACFFQGQNLCHCRFYISCVCVAHGLDDNGIRSTHFQTADFNFSCQFSFHSLTFSKFRKRPIYIRRFVSFKSCIF